MASSGPGLYKGGVSATERLARVREALLAWYGAHRRDLPWRRTRDPYAIWISEIMLQQTRVDTVRPYYTRFLARWPNVQALAAADPDEVRAQWSGLGYYRRAKLMLQAARVLAEEHDARFPTEPESLRALPGFGRYTAGAVASIAFDRPAPAVDGNVSRVLARLELIEGDVTKGEGAKSVWSTAEALAPGEHPGDLTQALIELGALVCSRRSPACGGCPVAASCRAHAAGRVDEIPPPRKRAARKSMDLTALVAVRDGAVLLARRPEEGIFASLWCPPLLEGHLPPDAAGDEAHRALGVQLSRVRPLGRITHVLTHRDLNVDVLRAEIHAAPDGTTWAPLDALSDWGIPSFTAKVLRAALDPVERGRLDVRGRQTTRDRQARTGQLTLLSDD